MTVSATGRHFIEFLPATPPPVLHPPPTATFLSLLATEQKQALYILFIPGKQLAISSFVNQTPYVATPVTLGNWTDLASTAGGVVVSTAAGLFQPWMVGFSLVFTAGTGFTAGTYKIVAFNSQQSVTLQSSPSPSAVGSGGVATLNITLLPDMQIPKGASQKVDELNGQSNISTFSVNCVDPDDTLKLASADPGVIGQLSAFTIGFPGLDVSQFATLHTNRVAAFAPDERGQITITVQDLMIELVSDIFVNGGPDPWAIGDPTPPQHTPPPSVRDNGVPVSSSNPRYFSGNAMNLLLAVVQNELGLGQATPPALVVTTGGGSGTGQAGFGINPSWQFYDGASDATLINPNPYVDVPSILLLRNTQFSGDRMEFTFTAPQSGKSWIEEQILKPRGLFWVTRPTGELTLKSMKHPEATAAASATPISDSQIEGIPKTDRWPVINMIQASIPADTEGGGDQATITFVQDTSRKLYPSPQPFSLSSDGLRFVYGGFGQLFLVVNRIFNRHAFATPEYTITTQLQFLLKNIGEFFLLTHTKLIDPATGLRGVSNVLVEITDKQPDYAQAKITFKVADTRFMKLPTGAFQIASAAAGIPVWASASPSQRQQYIFISANTGLMSDGSPGNTVA